MKVIPLSKYGPIIGFTLTSLSNHLQNTSLEGSFTFTVQKG